ncbi:MAG: hypothetical protein JNM24_09975 [Bdellovibrionaceae bacterium]|nr:hypothetical protein [Pseudobdellovibrionaceae bacterium]
MKTKLILLAVVLVLSPKLFAQKNELAKLTYSSDTILDYVLAKKKLVRNPALAVPEILLESVTPLEVFQTALHEQWNFLPEFFTNAYSVKSNRIFLMDKKSYYDRLKRCIDDSLAHELVHYVQVVYQKWDLSDESLEWDAVDIQTQFREDFCTRHENSRISKIRH